MNDYLHRLDMLGALGTILLVCSNWVMLRAVYIKAERDRRTPAPDQISGVLACFVLGSAFLTVGVLIQVFGVKFRDAREVLAIGVIVSAVHTMLCAALLEQAPAREGKGKHHART